LKDFRDPSLIGFTVQMQAGYGTSNPAGATATALIANQMVQTVTRQ